MFSVRTYVVFVLFLEEREKEEDEEEEVGGKTPLEKSLKNSQSFENKNRNIKFYQNEALVLTRAKKKSFGLTRNFEFVRLDIRTTKQSSQPNRSPDF